MITAQDIRDVIESADDFGHELRVRHILRGHQQGQLRHGGTYVDPVTQKPRQYDLRWDVSYSAGFAVSLAIECKNIHAENPVIISGIKRTPHESFHYFIESRTGGSFLIQKFPAFYDVESMGIVRRTIQASEMYPAKCFVGKSIIRVERSESGKPPNLVTKYVSSKDQEIYDRWSQALASATDLVLEARHNAAKYNQAHVFTIIVPVVVLPNRVLWFAEYDENGGLIHDPAEVDHCELFVGREIVVPAEFTDLPPSLFTFSHIHFFTIDGFADFLLTVAQDAQWLDTCFPADVTCAARDERLS